MRYATCRLSVVFIAVLILVERVVPVLAAGPAITMIYGDLKQPIFALYAAGLQVPDPLGSYARLLQELRA